MDSYGGGCHGSVYCVNCGGVCSEHLRSDRYPYTPGLLRRAEEQVPDDQELEREPYPGFISDATTILRAMVLRRSAALAEFPEIAIVVARLAGGTP